MKLRPTLIALGKWASLILGVSWLLAYWLLKPDPAVLAVGISFLALGVSIAAYSRMPA